MSAALYYPVYMYLTYAIALMYSSKYSSSNGYGIQEKGDNNTVVPLILMLAISIFVGNRPIHYLFGDTVNYARGYAAMIPGDVKIDWHSEWVWQWFMVMCKSLGLTISQFFTIVDLVYFMVTFYAAKKIIPNNSMMTCIFFLTSLMFFSFGTNGIRNGVACQITLLGIAYLLEGKMPLAIGFFLTAFGIHRSTMLPIAMCIASIYFIKDVKYALFVWLAAIPLSLFFGGPLMSFFSGLGFDDRISAYAQGDTSMFSKTGFRWDFLLYSAAPVVLVWYVCIYKQISDNWYNVIASTYCICNAFWIMVIRASYSNRFAYLSWFLYPLVVAYPLIMLPVWMDQDNKIFQITMAYASFTLFMSFVWNMM